MIGIGYKLDLDNFSSLGPRHIFRIDSERLRHSHTDSVVKKMMAPGKLTLTCLDDRCGEVYSLPFLITVV